MLLSAVSVLVVVQSSSEIPEGLMNNPVHETGETRTTLDIMRVYRISFESSGYVSKNFMVIP